MVEPGPGGLSSFGCGSAVTAPITMDTFFALNGCLHIVPGFTGFFVAPVALALRKGGVAHRRWG